MSNEAVHEIKIIKIYKTSYLYNVQVYTRKLLGNAPEKNLGQVDFPAMMETAKGREIHLLRRGSRSQLCPKGKRKSLLSTHFFFFLFSIHCKTQEAQHDTLIQPHQKADKLDVPQDDPWEFSKTARYWNPKYFKYIIGYQKSKIADVDSYLRYCRQGTDKAQHASQARQAIWSPSSNCQSHWSCGRICWMLPCSPMHTITHQQQSHKKGRPSHYPTNINLKVNTICCEWIFFLWDT